MGRPDKAKRFVEMALALDPDYKDAKELKAKIEGR
jgi:hypothetical protein